MKSWWLLIGRSERVGRWYRSDSQDPGCCQVSGRHQTASLHLIWHLTHHERCSILRSDSANTAQVPGTVLIVTRALILWWSEAPPDKPCAHSHVRSCSVKMSQNMTSGYRFPFSLIPPFTQHVILLCKHLFSAASLPWCPFCWLFSAFLCHCQNFPPDEDPPSWQLAPPPRGCTEMVNGEMHQGLDREKGNVVFCVLKQLKIKKSLVIYPATCVAFIVWYCPPGRSCNPWWNRGLGWYRHNTSQWAPRGQLPDRLDWFLTSRGRDYCILNLQAGIIACIWWSVPWRRRTVALEK